MLAGQPQAELATDQLSDFFDGKGLVPAFQPPKNAQSIIDFGIKTHALLGQDAARLMGQSFDRPMENALLPIVGTASTLAFFVRGR